MLKSLNDRIPDDMKQLPCNTCRVLLLEKILGKVMQTITNNIPFEHFEFFCQKLQLKNAMIKTIESDRLVITTRFPHNTHTALEQGLSNFLLSGALYTLKQGLHPIQVQLINLELIKRLVCHCQKTGRLVSQTFRVQS